MECSESSRSHGADRGVARTGARPTGGIRHRRRRGVRERRRAFVHRFADPHRGEVGCEASVARKRARLRARYRCSGSQQDASFRKSRAGARYPADAAMQQPYEDFVASRRWNAGRIAVGRRLSKSFAGSFAQSRQRVIDGSERRLDIARGVSRTQEHYFVLRRR